MTGTIEQCSSNSCFSPYPSNLDELNYVGINVRIGFMYSLLIMDPPKNALSIASVSSLFFLTCPSILIPFVKQT